MNLPIELIEKIIRNCDGRTLIQLKEVDNTFKQIVDYLTEKTEIWKWCCYEDIPKNEIIEYQSKHYSSQEKAKWLDIYLNWASWQNIDCKIHFDIVLSPIEIPRISCIAVSGSYIAVGTENGRAKIYTQNWKLISVSRHQALRVQEISFINNGDNFLSELCYVVAYPKTLIIESIVNHLLNIPIFVHDVKTYSIYQNYICYEQLGGRLTISKVIIDGSIQLEEVWFDRIYMPKELTCLNVWNGTLTLLFSKELKTLEYNKKDICPVANLKQKTRIKFSFSPIRYNYDCQILRDDLIVNLYKDDSFKQQYVEFVILGQNNLYSQKLFNSWEVLQAFITCIYAYGNTLILGVDVGIIYIYHIESWKTFDIRTYEKKMIIGKHPIISIDMKETKNERKFYVSSSYNIHEVVGYTTNFIN